MLVEAQEPQYLSVDRDYTVALTEYVQTSTSTLGLHAGEAAMDVDDDLASECIDRDYADAVRDVASMNSVGTKRRETVSGSYDHTTDLGNDRNYRIAATELRNFRKTSADAWYEAVGDGAYALDQAGDRAYNTAELEIATYRAEKRMARIAEGEVIDASNDRSYANASAELQAFRMNNQSQQGLVLGDGSVCKFTDAQVFPTSSAAATDACNDRHYGSSTTGASSAMVMTPCA